MVLYINEEVYSGLLLSIAAKYSERYVGARPDTNLSPPDMVNGSEKAVS